MVYLWSILMLYYLSSVGRMQSLSVSLSESILLNQQFSGIKTMGKDFEGDFLVSYENGEARKYVPNFTSYTPLNLLEPIDRFDTRQVVLNTILLNGTFLNLTSRKAMLKSRNFTMVRDYNYDTFALEESYSINQTILSEFGYPIVVSNISHAYHVLVCNNSILVAYRGAVTYLLNYSTIFGSGITCIVAMYYTNSLNFNWNSLTGRVQFYVSLSVGGVYEFNVNLIFQFNSTANHFDLSSQSQTHVFITTLLTPITSLFLTTGLLMMQSNSTGITTIYNVNSSLMGATLSIPLNQIFNFIYASSALYVLQSTGLYQLTFNPLLNLIVYNGYSVTLPYNKYFIVLGSIINAFYIPGQPYLYKGSPCSGQTQLQGSACVAYNCSDGNCPSCPISSSLCSACNTGFLLEQNYTCSLSNTGNVTNSTTNSTYANTTNPANNTNTDNSSSNSINEFTGEPGNIFSLEWLIQYLINAFKAMISAPAARRVLSPVFYYFCIFDDIYLFQFHDRLYGAAMNNLFANINDIQSKKWSLLDYQTILALLQVDPSAFQNATDYQNAYNDYPFTEANHTDVGSEGLWANCQNFFVVALPLTLVAFLVFRLLFRLSFHHAVSLWVRKFDLWPFLLLLLFDGNIQEFAFYQATDWKHMFSSSVLQKVIKVQIICFGFLLLVVSTALYFLARGFYARLSRYVMDNNRSGIAGMAALTLQTGVKNCCLGVLHSVLRGSGYERMLWTLLGCEAVFLLCFMVMLMAGVYRRALKMWVYVLLNLVKMLLMATLLADYQCLNTPAIEAAQLGLIITEFVLFAFGVSLETYCTFKQVFYQFQKTFSSQKSPSPLNKMNPNPNLNNTTTKYSEPVQIPLPKENMQPCNPPFRTLKYIPSKKVSPLIRNYNNIPRWFSNKIPLKVKYVDRNPYPHENDWEN